MSSALTLLAFWALVGFTAKHPERRAQLRARQVREWSLDLAGLTVQGLLIPLVLIVPLVTLYARMFPGLGGSIALPGWLSFLLAFVLVDYAYYWNHRMLHGRVFWPLHRVHHSAERMDVFVTSRNTLWTSLFIVYLWASSIMTFLLADPTPYLLGAALTAALDLARHAPLDLSEWPRLERLLGHVLILPRDHALHHADLPEHGNYGANLVFWDRLHDTYLTPRPVPAQLGIVNPLSLTRSLLWPYFVKTADVKNAS